MACPAVLITTQSTAGQGSSGTQPAPHSNYKIDAALRNRDYSMPITMNDLTINPQGIDMAVLLDDWKWAMPEPLKPVLLTALGDVFAQGESGAVYLIDAVGGTVTSVAPDGATFQGLLSDSQFVTEYFMPQRIVQLREAGMTLTPEHVYSHKHPLVLGGEDDLENVEVASVQVHLGIHGQIHEQVKDLPEGTPIGDIKFE